MYGHNSEDHTRFGFRSELELCVRADRVLTATPCISHSDNINSCVTIHFHVEFDDPMVRVVAIGAESDSCIERERYGIHICC